MVASSSSISKLYVIHTVSSKSQ
eukprot:CCRYP_018660-RA/>CCRYP_018660-RA protein AED:0.42 eAED:1.00 QI:0/-1/0/1/-1/0/1/0/22